MAKLIGGKHDGETTDTKCSTVHYAFMDWSRRLVMLRIYERRDDGNFYYVETRPMMEAGNE